MSHKKRREVLQSADVLINVSGTLRKPEIYRDIPRLVYIDSDPGFTQVKLNLRRGQKKFSRRVNTHDVFFSFGESFSNSTPITGHNWLPTRQPILLSEWRTKRSRTRGFTTVMSWTSYKPLIYQRRRFGQKDVEFMRFIQLPSLFSDTSLEVALGVTQHENWQSYSNKLPEIANAFIAKNPNWTSHSLIDHLGWHIVNAGNVTRDLDSYRDYIQSSTAEWSVEKNGYVEADAGWFSCRSACYLASGRPVVVQDTGFGRTLPVGEGILSFNTLDEAETAIIEVQSNYSRHSTAALAIASEYFDSDKVLTRLVEDSMNSKPANHFSGIAS